MIQVWGITDRGVVRSQNQDAFSIRSLEGGSLVTAIVCDGMGGARAGNVASTLAVKVSADHLANLSPEELRRDPAKHLVQAAGVANEAVYYKAITDPECWGMGTTMVSAIARESRVQVLNIGDSRAYRIGEDGILKVTRDHSLVEDLVQRGDITPEEARQHPQKNLITRALGSDPTAKVDLYDVEVRRGDYILLCTDGLSNVLTDGELLEETLRGSTPEESCRRMLGIALDRGAPDNVTVVLIFFA